MAPPTAVTVELVWDTEANVYIATSDDVPGLVAEAETVEQLNQKIRYLIPLLLEENKHLFGDELNLSVPIDLLIQQRTAVTMRGQQKGIINYGHLPFPIGDLLLTGNKIQTYGECGFKTGRN